MLSSTTWIFTAFVYTAHTGLDYRRYKKGTINKEELIKRMKTNSVATLGGVTGGIGGSAAGFAIGTVLFPGVGSVVGTIIGGMGGGMLGSHFSTKAYQSIEDRMEEARKKKE